jgi:polyhydroxyalkanoate synthesis regulator phasin
MEAPRWRLTNPHYLRVPELPDGTKVEWEHKETSRESGRAVRKLYPVPILLDPKDPADHNYPGEIIVTSEVDGAHCLARDMIFLGDPTQEMEPLNAEAEAITESLREKWIHPVDTLPANGGMTSAEAQFMQTMMSDFAKQIGAAIPKANLPVPEGEVDELKKRLAALEALLAEKAQGVRRV